MNESPLSTTPARKQTTYIVIEGSLLPRAGALLLLQHAEPRYQPLDERPILHDRAEENEALARLVVLGDSQQSPAQLHVLTKLLGRLDEPGVDPGVDRSPGLDRKLKIFRIINEIAGMNGEKSRQQRARRRGDVRARPLLDLREVGLAHTAAEVFANASGNLGLRELPTESSREPLELPEVSYLLAKSHCNL